jgi:sugar phosphate isomerase/epimerase
MQLGIFAKTFPGTRPEAVMAASAAAGFATVQYNMACSGLVAMPDAISTEQAREVASAARKCGVAVAAISGTYNMIHPDRTVREQGLRRLAIMAERCRDMGTGLITLCTGTRDADDQWRHHLDNSSKQAWADLVAGIEKALAIAEQQDVQLGVEPELSNVVSSAALAARLIKEMQNPRLRIVLDAANLFEAVPEDEQRRIVSSSVELLAGHIAMAHAKDRAADGSFVAAGQGVLNYRHYLRTLMAAGFDGPLVTHGLAAGEAAGVASFLRRNLADAGAAA